MKKVAIIGAGLGGLACGAMLSKSGMKVTVFERFIPGGYATSFRRRISGMEKPAEFEVSLHLLSDLGEGGALREVLQEIGVLERVDFIRAKNLYCARYPDGDIIVDSYDSYLKSLQELFPKEREGIEGLFTLFVQIREEMLIMLNKMNRGEPVNILRDGRTVLTHHQHTLEQVFNMYIQSTKLKSIIAQLWSYHGLPPSKMSAIYYAYVWTEYLLFGGYYPEGRSQQISNALIQIIKENGGELLTNHAVVEIATEQGEIRGLMTSKGYFNTDIVISNVDPKQTFEKLIGYEKLPKNYVKKIKSIKPSLGCIQAHIIVDTDFASTFNEKNYEIFVNEYDDLELGYQETIQECYETMPFGITIYENLNPKYQIHGKTTLSLFMLCRYEDWIGLEEKVYREKKTTVQQILLNRLERMYPGVNTYIDHVELSTPRTNEHYTGNFKGAIYGAQQTIDQSWQRRLSQKTPVKGLYLTGAWTQPGGGYSGVIWSGYNLSRQLILANQTVETK